MTAESISQLSTSSRATIRWLVAIYVLLLVFSSVISFMQNPFLPETFREHNASNFQDIATFGDALPLIVGLAALVLGIIALCCLWFGWSGGRPMFVFANLVGIIAGAVCPIMVNIPVLTALEHTISIIGGVLIGFLYFAPRGEPDLVGVAGDVPVSKMGLKSSNVLRAEYREALKQQKQGTVSQEKVASILAQLQQASGLERANSRMKAVLGTVVFCLIAIIVAWAKLKVV